MKRLYFSVVLYFLSAFDISNAMSDNNAWAPVFDIEESVNDLESHSGKKQITPREYLKIIEEADKTFASVDPRNVAVRADANISTMLAQTSGILSAEKKNFMDECCPRVSTQNLGKVINDRIPIIMDGEYFKIDNEKKKNTKQDETAQQ